MFKEFLGFLVAAGLCHHKVNHIILIVFMQFLSENGCSASNIANYIAGIRCQCIICDIDTTPYRHEQIQLFSKALKINRDLNPGSASLIDIQMLTDIIAVSNSL